MHPGDEDFALQPPGAAQAPDRVCDSLTTGLLEHTLGVKFREQTFAEALEFEVVLVGEAGFAREQSVAKRVAR
ncbi:MAG: hypothetical protein M3R39_08905 [Actinomycetota bacterium]|nr:hypothetical protein [Actinomycetota bacterium]